MIMTKKIIVGIPPKNHIRLALDEIEGLTEMGYNCKTAIYGRNDQSAGKVSKILSVFVNAFKIIFFLYRFRPDILYLNSRFEFIASIRDFISIFLIKNLFFGKIKIVIKTHGSDLSLLQKKYPFKNTIINFLTANVDKWLFLSQEEKLEISKLSVQLSRKIEITANIIDAERSVASIEFKKRHNLDSPHFKFLFVGRIVKEKGIFSILRSIPELYFKEKCRFVFVGNGPDYDELLHEADRLKILEYLVYPGYIEDEECDHFYANVDALVFPTFYAEGFPMALFKSVAAGLPIITTRIRAAKDYLISPDNVIWVEEESIESTKRAMIEIYEDEILRQNMSRNNKALGYQFSRLNVAIQMDEVFRSL